MLTFKVRVLSTGFVLPVAFHPVIGSCPKETLAVLTEDCIKSLQENDVQVICSVSDQDPAASRQRSYQDFKRQMS